MSKQSLETKIYSYQEAYTTMDRSKFIMLLMAILPCIIMYSQGKYTITIGEFPVRILVSSAESRAIQL
jgi:hypothetical protein